MSDGGARPGERPGARLVGPPLDEARLAPAAIERALSSAEAAREAGDRIALIAGDAALTFAAVAARVATAGAATAAEPGAVSAIVGAASLDGALAVIAAAARGEAIAPLHPRWSAERRAAAAAALPARAPGAFALIHTSGSSGAPKLAVLSRRAAVASALATADALGWRDDDRWLCPLPLAHVGGLMIVVRGLIGRRAVVLAEGVGADPAALAAAIAGARVTIASLVPTQLAALLDAGYRAPDHLRLVVLGGAAAPAALRARAAAAGLRVVTTYGMTETASMVALDGAPVAGAELAVRDGGRVAVRGPMLMDGYVGAGDVRDPRDPRDPRDDDGWLDTADLGRIEGGRLVIAGRADDVIVTGGENVHPGEVEAALVAVPGVRAACVFGVADERWGQLVACALVTTDGAPPAGLDAALAELPGFQRPRLLAVVDRLELGPTGKLDRRATAARAAPRLRPRLAERDVSRAPRAC